MWGVLGGRRLKAQGAKEQLSFPIIDLDNPLLPCVHDNLPFRVELPFNMLTFHMLFIKVDRAKLVNDKSGAQTSGPLT